MSADAPAAARDGPDVSTADYDRMLDDLDVAIAEARRKIDEGRVRDPSLPTADPARAPANGGDRPPDPGD